MWMRNINRHMNWIDLSLKVKRYKALQSAAAEERARLARKPAPIRSIRLAEKYARRRAA